MMHWHNLRYIIRHKWFVFRECCRLGIPWLGVIHDWSKVLPDEWWAYARYFYGDYPTENEVKRIPAWTGFTNDRVKSAFDQAWLKHQHRNKHHWQYWYLINDTEPAKSLPMPERYIKEMCADWKGASAARGAGVRDWWSAHGHVLFEYMDHDSYTRFRTMLLAN